MSILLFVSLINMLFSIANLATSVVDAKNISYAEGLSNRTMTPTELAEYVKLTDYTFADIQYHDDMETISKQPEIYGLPSGTKFRTDKNGDKYMTLIDNKFTYYEPDTLKEFGPSQYVPSYEDSVYLSKYNTEMQNSAYERE